MNKVHEDDDAGQVFFKKPKEDVSNKFRRAIDLMVLVEDTREPVSRATLRNLYMVEVLGCRNNDIEIENIKAPRKLWSPTPPSMPDYFNPFDAIRGLSHHNARSKSSKTTNLALEYDAYSDSALQMLVDLKLIKETEEMSKKDYSITTRGELVVAYKQGGAYPNEILKMLAHLC